MSALPEGLSEAQLPAAVLEVLQVLKAKGHQAFLVGGCVRDLVRRQTPKDFDLATSARPEEVQACFRKVIPTGIEHGTVTVLLGGQHLEVTTFRSEGAYLDGRRPTTVAFEREIAADLSRRDFTINAMAFDPVARELVDPFDGQGDLRARLVRCVGQAVDRFSEDGLRAMRAVRFATVLDFSLDPATESAIPLTLEIFRKVSMERVREELCKVLLSPHAVRGLGLLQRTGLLGAALPEVGADVDFAPVAKTPPLLELRLAALLVGAQDPSKGLERLKLPSKQAAAALHLLRHRGLPPDGAGGPALRRWLAQVGREHASSLVALAHALGRDTGPFAAELDGVLAAKPPLTAKELALDGAGIMKTLGLRPSPAVGEATRWLLEQVLDAPEKNTPQTLENLLRQWPSRPSG